MTRRMLLHVAVMAAAASASAAWSGTRGRQAMPRWAPFELVTSLGHPRPIVVARFNGHPMPMMIHSQTDFFAQLKHSQAAAFGVRLAGGHSSYGIERPGHVSGLGRDEGVVSNLKVLGAVDRDAPVSVFEVPQDDYGMLGIDWIVRHRLIMDFARRRVLLSPSPGQAAAVAAWAGRAGYVAIPLEYDPDRKAFWTEASINGVRRRMGIATAGQLMIDDAFAKAAGVATGADDGHGSGPTGAHVAEYRLGAPVRVSIGSWTSPMIADGRVMDMYGYSARSRPKDPISAEGGNLGGAFLQATGAIVDFASKRLYVRAG